MGYRLDFGALVQYLGLFLEGTAVTLGLTAVASVAGVALGIAGAPRRGVRMTGSGGWLRSMSN